ncbi:MAG TPA: hypothetical protein VLJ86_00335, partial [Ramlibacter sp.]|nr:hypothetical protein [Ramlibacter sp.]
MSMTPTSNVVSFERDALTGSTLRDKLSGATAQAVPVPGQSGVGNTDSYRQLKGRIHLKLLELLDLVALEALAPDQLRQEIASMVERLLQDEQAAINDLERATLIRDIQHEMLGFGPLELLMADPTVS